MSQSQIDKIKEHASSYYPEECVGALLGNFDGSHRTFEVIPLENASVGSKAFRYSIKPQDLLSAEETAEQTGSEVIGFYHSHPNAPPVPSSVDNESAWPWYVYLIVSVVRGRAERWSAWKLDEQARCFIPVGVNIT